MSDVICPHNLKRFNTRFHETFPKRGYDRRGKIFLKVFINVESNSLENISDICLRKHSEKCFMDSFLNVFASVITIRKYFKNVFTSAWNVLKTHMGQWVANCVNAQWRCNTNRICEKSIYLTKTNFRSSNVLIKHPYYGVICFINSKSYWQFSEKGLILNKFSTFCYLKCT